MIPPRDGLPPGVRLIQPLGPHLEDREVWQAETADGTPVVVELVNQSVDNRAAACIQSLRGVKRDW